jgi:hypothetical protein
LDDRANGSAELGSASINRSGGQANVMIPVPLAAWSGLSVLGGLGLLAGVRRVVRRFK